DEELLGGGGGDAAEGLRLHHLAGARGGHDAAGAVDGDLDRLLVVEALGDGESDGLLDAGEDGLFGDLALPGDVVHAAEQLGAVHEGPSRFSRQSEGGRPARPGPPPKRKRAGRARSAAVGGGPKAVSPPSRGEPGPDPWRGRTRWPGRGPRPSGPG